MSDNSRLWQCSTGELQANQKFMLNSYKTVFLARCVTSQGCLPRDMVVSVKERKCANIVSGITIMPPVLEPESTGPVISLSFI